jgi:ubiquitin C-terminal hydrolase
MKGLNNIGNTCYLNAGLQMLLQNKDLYQLVLKHSNHSEILRTIANFYDEYYNSSNGSLNPSNIKTIVEERQKMFQGFNQHDSSEFVIYLLDIINDEMKDSTQLNSIYGLHMNIRIKCKFRECLNIVNKKEISNILFLDLEPEYKDLDDMYRSHRSKDKLDSDNMYFCDKCKDKRIASKRTNIEEWPSHLIIILKRFKQTGFRVQKMNQPLDIPLEWRHENILQGAIIHYGSMGGGHYVYVGKYKDKWYLFDDSNVSEIPSQEKLKVLLTHAYCLYYTNSST